MIQVELEKSIVAPGEPIRGKILWSTDALPSQLSARLVWSTEGKGDDDEDMAIEQSWDISQMSGEQTLDWIAPRGPISLVGKLIRITWSIDVDIDFNAKRSKTESSRASTIVISHLTKPVHIASV